ncbi:LysR family transcriptional regulator [alpha proteobacterium AAP38]|uniref:LysR family transcriptional regulator n=1 Tax=Niveispirillum sp. TaxID=1917217 RepID=UPI0006B894FB|nr:LysR family transcriptional regulator [alpha proteobacterium AAP38]
MRYKGLDLNLLHALDVLLEERNVSRAADRLGLSQSALSAALSRMRDFFGDELLMLEGRRMHPTAFAEQLASQLRVALAGIDTLLLTSRNFTPETAERTFRVIASDYIVTAILSRLAERFTVTAPGIRLNYIALDEAALDRLMQGDMDIMIAPREYLSPALPVEELYKERFVVAGWSENPLFRRTITTEDILASGHISVEIGSRRSSTFADYHMRLLFGERRIEATVSSFAVVPWMLRGTNRLTLMHERLARVLATELPLAFAPLPFEFPEMQEMVQYHRTKSGDAGVRWLIEQIRVAAEGASFS